MTDAFMEEFLRCPQIAADFSTYYRLYQATGGCMEDSLEYLKGTLTAKERAASSGTVGRMPWNRRELYDSTLSAGSQLPGG